MSSGGRRGIDLSGNQSMRIQSSTDYVYQKKVQLIYTTNNAISNAGIGAWTGRNAYQNHTPNGTGFVNQFLNGLRECDCSGGFPGMTNGNITQFS